MSSNHNHMSIHDIGRLVTSAMNASHRQPVSSTPYRVFAGALPARKVPLARTGTSSEGRFMSLCNVLTDKGLYDRFERYWS